MRALRILLVLCGLALAGCASGPALRHAAEEDFQFSGRVAVSHAGQRHSARVHWTHRATGDEILLQGPLGQTMARVELNGDGAVLDVEGTRHRAPDAEGLTEKVLGWRLPLSGMRAWLRAAASPGSPAITDYADNGQLARLEQDGWEIRYLRYTGTPRQALPQRMQLRRAGLELTLIIDAWMHPSPN